MKLRQAHKQLSKIKLALQGPSGSGKTYSALLLAKGLVSNFQNVAIIDTENGSADLYADMGPYRVLTLTEPFSPERYIQAIEQCEQAGAECIILDSTTHCWDFLLDCHANMVGNSFTNWSKITPRHKAFVNKILQSSAHIIATMRVKQDYVLNEKNGKQVPEKVGLKAIQRDGLDYEFTIVFDLDVNHFANCAKDRTGLYVNQPVFRIIESTGQQILNWMNQIAHKSNISLETRINECLSLQELMDLYTQIIKHRPDLGPEFTRRREELQSFHPSKSQSNGTLNRNN